MRSWETTSEIVVCTWRFESTDEHSISRKHMSVELFQKEPPESSEDLSV